MMIKDALNKYLSQKKLVDELYAKAKAAKELLDELNIAVQFEMQAVGTKAFRDDDITASLVNKDSISITDEKAVIEWIKNQPEIDSDMYIGVKKVPFNALAKIALKTNGEIVPGTTIEVTEYLTIKQKKEDK